MDTATTITTTITDTNDLVFKAMLSSFFVGPLEVAYTSSFNEQQVRYIMHQRPPIAVVGSFVTCNKLKHLPKGKIVYVNIYYYYSYYFNARDDLAILKMVQVLVRQLMPEIS